VLGQGRFTATVRRSSMADHAVATGGMVDEESPQNGTDHVPHTVSIQNEAHEKNYKQNSKVPGTDCENGTAVQRDGRDKMMVSKTYSRHILGSSFVFKVF
jgi:hypothetical protein